MRFRRPLILSNRLRRSSSVSFDGGTDSGSGALVSICRARFKLDRVAALSCKTKLSEELFLAAVVSLQVLGDLLLFFVCLFSGACDVFVEEAQAAVTDASVMMGDLTIVTGSRDLARFLAHEGTSASIRRLFQPSYS